ncbi:hypothetical protein G8V04_14360 [Clostridium botulinum C/D]|nr:hypothetical protein [Clostridium botulinum C/D]
MSVINMAQQFKKLPSEIMRIEDEYTAYCFNEACSYILNQMQQEEPPKFKFDDEVSKGNNDFLEFVKENNKPVQ